MKSYTKVACTYSSNTSSTRGGKNGSLYTNPLGKRLLAMACNTVTGFKSEALPILKFKEPGCITMIDFEWQY